MRELILASDVEKVVDKIGQAGFLENHENGVFIPTASLGKNYESFFSNVIRPNFQKQGVSMNLLELSQASSSEITSALQRATLLYVGGGNTFLLLEKMKATGFAEHLGAFFEKGGLYIGSSAGAVVAGPDIAFIACMDNPSGISLTDFSGLNLVSFNILPHIDHPHYSEQARQADFDNRPTIGLREDQFLYVKNTYTEVF